MYDVVLSNGLIVDGTGREPYLASCGIKGDKIIAIAKDLPGGKRRIDISGLAVSPGFIDIHSHSDLAFIMSERSESKVFQGVTTEVVGCCGISVEPSREETINDYKKFVSAICETGPMEWEFGSLQEYIAELDKKRKTINCIPQIGHGTLRIFAMGFDNRRANENEMNLMKSKLDEELSQGAWGMSAGLSYAPGSFAPTSELVELAEVIARHKAAFSVHMRSESDDIFNAVEEMIEVGKKSGADIHISHLKLMGRPQWGKSRELISRIKKAQLEGCNISCDQYPYEASETYLGVVVPKWAMEGGITGKPIAFNGTKRTEMLNEIKKEVARRGGPERVLLSSGSVEISAWEGYNLEQISRELKMPPEETVVKLLNIANGSILANYFSMDGDDVRTILKENWIAVGSDGIAYDFDNKANPGKPHPRNFGTFPLVLRMARETNIMTLAEAIYKMTSLPAKILGLKNRGRIEKGCIADIVVFDPERIADAATFANPISKPVGMNHVFVAGKPVIFDGIQQNEYPGKDITKK